MTVIVGVSDAFVAYPSPAGTVMALRGLNLTVAPGERLLVEGPNGSGKSTLLRLLTGEQSVTAGTVTVGGTDLTRLSPSARRRWRRAGVGMVDQHSRRALLPEWRVADNVALQLRLAGIARGPAVRRAADTLDRLGLAHLRDRSISTLSGGEAQRVAICAAVAHDPALILADEPTGELDELAARQVYQLLADAGRSHGAALILVSHDRRAGELVDRAVRLRDGRLAEQWLPSAGGRESQVVDQRGWVRLPAGLLPSTNSSRADPTGGDPAGADFRSSHPAGRGGPITMRALAMPGGDIRLVSESRSPAFTADRAVDLPGNRLRSAVPVAVLPAADSRHGAPPPLLQLTDVGVIFGSTTVLAQVDLVIRPGDFTVVRGPSGSGKSTLLALAAGLSDPTSGAVGVAGTDWRPLDRSARAQLRRRHVTVALQSTVLADALTVEENLRFAAALRGRDSGDVGAVADDLGLTALLAQPVRLLSGGERQRVAFARCLVSAAELMLLDEPTSQQDEAAAVAVALAVLAAARRGRAVLAASHDPVFLDAADSILDMDRLGMGRGDVAGSERQPPR